MRSNSALTAKVANAIHDELVLDARVPARYDNSVGAYTRELDVLENLGQDDGIERVVGKGEAEGVADHGEGFGPVDDPLTVEVAPDRPSRGVAFSESPEENRFSLAGEADVEDPGAGFDPVEDPAHAWAGPAG